MPSNSPRLRALALPLIGALISSGLLLGSAGTSAASSAPANGTTVTAAPVAAKNLSLQQRKKIRKNKIQRAVRVAKNQIGDPYSYGSADRKSGAAGKAG